MKKVSPLDYAFAIGKVRALEAFLIKQEVFEEALEASLPEALKLFVEADLYSDELQHVQESAGLERVLGQEALRLKKLTGELLLDAPLLPLVDMGSLACVEEVLANHKSEFLADYLRHRADMHNI